MSVLGESTCLGFNQVQRLLKESKFGFEVALDSVRLAERAVEGFIIHGRFHFSIAERFGLMVCMHFDSFGYCGISEFIF